MTHQPVPPFPAPQTDEAPRIIVIRRDNIGDLVCTTPLVRALRKRFPQARLCMLVNSYNRAAVDNNPDIDKVYAYTKGKHRAAGESLIGVYWCRMRMFWELRRERFDYAIIAGAHFLPRALSLARALRPRHIIGFTEAGKPGTSHIDIGIPYDPPRPLHEVEDIFRLLAPLGIEGTPPPARVYAEAAEITRVQASMRERWGDEPGPCIGVHISARKPSNRWPAEHFVALLRRLHTERSARFLLFWAPGAADDPRHPGDDDKANEILDGVQGLPVLPIATERLEQLIAGLSCCQQVICSDGGAMHIAAALDKPTLCFFGNSDRIRWHPWGVPHLLLQPPSRDVRDVSPAEASAAFAELVSMSGLQ
jgi:ADP-heptose:LPS heptosyltransferase